MTWASEKIFVSCHQMDGAYRYILTDLMNRLEYPVREGLKPRPLFCIPVLTMLSSTDGSSEPSRTTPSGTIAPWKELLGIEPSDDEKYHLRQHKSVLGKPFFPLISTGEMEKG